MKTRIKTLLSIAIILMASLGATAQSAFFKECEKIPGVQTVYISKIMLGMASKSGINAGKVDVTSLVGKLDGLEIINAEGEAAKKLEKKLGPMTGYETMLSVNSDEDNVKILFKDLGNGRSEFRLISRDPGELTVIVFPGTMTMEEVLEAVNK